MPGIIWFELGLSVQSGTFICETFFQSLCPSPVSKGSCRCHCKKSMRLAEVL